MSTGAILLAAGASTRMGFPKQLLTIGGETLLRRAARVLIATECRPVVVVLGAQWQRMSAQLSDLPVTVVENPNWPDGMGSSIRAGLEGALHIDPKLQGVLIALCDQPRVTASDLLSLLDLSRTAGKPVTASSYGGTLGVPAVFCKTIFPQLLRLEGAGGAGQLIRGYVQNLAQLPLSAASLDVDAINDLKAAGIDPQSHPGARAGHRGR